VTSQHRGHLNWHCHGNDKLRDYEMRQFWHWTISLLTAALQTISYAQETCSTVSLSMSAASVNVEAMFATTGLVLNGKRSVLATSIKFHSFMTIMHTCLILNRQETMKMSDFFQWHFHWCHQCALDCLALTFIYSACSVLYLLSFEKSMPPDLVL